MLQLKHFTLAEFDSKDAPGSGSAMQSDFLLKLDKARSLCGIPFKINSGFRTPAHNKAVGGEPNSSHTKGWAADIGYSSGTEGYRILCSLQAVGFNRIGIYKNWIHVDCDPALPSHVIWSK
jgi:uncharacterized protein YcbK (DUF882 family)